MTTRLLDSDVCITVLRGKSALLERRFKQALIDDESVLSSITVMELWYGVWRSHRPDVQRERLLTFLKGAPPVLPFDDADAEACAELRAELAVLGTPIGHYDALLAGQARRRGLTIVTGNVREFSRVRGLKVEDWSRP